VSVERPAFDRQPLLVRDHVGNEISNRDPGFSLGKVFVAEMIRPV